MVTVYDMQVLQQKTQDEKKQAVRATQQELKNETKKR